MTDVTDEEIWCKACLFEACKEEQLGYGTSDVTKLGHLEQKN